MARQWADGFRVVWAQQGISDELRNMLQEWICEVDKGLRDTSSNRMPSEWAKKVDCRDSLRDLAFPLPEQLPPELAAHSTSRSTANGKVTSRNDSLTREDLELINQTRAVSAETWFRVSQWGKKTKKLHWKVAAIAQTMGEYAIGSWERSPSTKQAKWAMEAYRTAEKEGAFEQPVS